MKTIPVSAGTIDTSICLELVLEIQAGVEDALVQNFNLITGNRNFGCMASCPLGVRYSSSSIEYLGIVVIIKTFFTFSIMVTRIRKLNLLIKIPINFKFTEVDRNI